MAENGNFAATYRKSLLLICNKICQVLTLYLSLFMILYKLGFIMVQHAWKFGYWTNSGESITRYILAVSVKRFVEYTASFDVLVMNQ